MAFSSEALNQWAVQMALLDTNPLIEAFKTHDPLLLCQSVCDHLSQLSPREFSDVLSRTRLLSGPKSPPGPERLQRWRHLIGQMAPQNPADLLFTDSEHGTAPWPDVIPLLNAL